MKKISLLIAVFCIFGFSAMATNEPSTSSEPIDGLITCGPDELNCCPEPYFCAK